MWTNNINRSDDGRFGIHNSTDTNSTVKAVCLNAAERSKILYGNQADKVNAIQADISLADYLDRHSTVVATATEYYRLAARPFLQWKAFQSVLDDLRAIISHLAGNSYLKLKQLRRAFDSINTN